MAKLKQRKGNLYFEELKWLFIALFALIFNQNLYADEASELQDTSHTVSWAYFSAKANGMTLWYIANLTNGNVYFLAPFTAGRAGWGIIGGNSPNSAAVIDLPSHRVSIKSGISAKSTVQGYYDANANNQYFNNSQYNAKDYAQLIEGKTIDIQWYFFKVSSNGSWYIAGAPTVSNNTIYRFGSDAQNQQYKWEVVSSLSRSYTQENSIYKVRLNPELPDIVSSLKETDTLPEIATWVFKFNDTSTVLSQVCTFPDLQNVPWAKSSIDALCSAGIVIGYADPTGTGREYKPTNTANLAEVLKVLTSTSDYNVLTQCEPYHLNSSGSYAWYVCYFNAASRAGLSKNSANASNTVTRGEAMTYIVNLFYFQSMSQQSALNFLLGKGIIERRADANYRLNELINRAELAVMAVRAASVTNKTLPYGKYGKPYVAGDYLPKSTITDVAGTITNYGQKVLERAKLQIGKTSGNGLKWVDLDTQTGKMGPMCQRFVWAMHDNLGANFNTAKAACAHFKNKGVLHTTGTPPIGASICYLDTSTNAFGHISIATGTGREIGATSTRGVTENSTPLSGLASYYQGWISAEDYKNFYYK